MWTLWNIQLTPSWSFCGHIWHLKPFFCMVPSSLLQCLGDFQVPLPPRTRSLLHLVILPAAVSASPSLCHRSEMSPGKSWGDSSAYQNGLYLVCIISTGFKYNFLIVGLPKPDFFWLLFDRMLSLFKKLLSLWFWWQKSNKQIRCLKKKKSFCLCKSLFFRFFSYKHHRLDFILWNMKTSLIGILENLHLV